MFAAQTTSRLDPFAQPLAGAMQADVEVVERQPERRGGFLGRRAVEVHALEHLAVLFGEPGQKALHTLAKHALGGGIGLFGKLGLQAFKRSLAHVAPPVEVNNGMTQDAIEPCHRAFTVTRRVGGLERLEQAVLHQIGGQFWVAHPLARERNEGVQVLNERVFGLCHARKVVILRRRGNRRRPAADLCHELECKRIRGSALARVNEAADRFDSEQRISL